METYCKHGHEFTEENIRWRTRSNGKKSRLCLRCYKARLLVTQRARRKRQKMEHPGGPEGYAADVRATRDKYEPVIRANGRIKRMNMKIAVMQHYSGGTPQCFMCGIDDMDLLCLDHIADDGAKHRKENKFSGGDKLYKWIIDNKFPGGFQVLCWNCNAKKEITRRRREYACHLFQ